MVSLLESVLVIIGLIAFPFLVFLVCGLITESVDDNEAKTKNGRSKKQMQHSAKNYATRRVKRKFK